MAPGASSPDARPGSGLTCLLEQLLFTQIGILFLSLIVLDLYVDFYVASQRGSEAKLQASCVDSHVVFSPSYFKGFRDIREDFKFQRPQNLMPCGQAPVASP